VLTSRFSTSDSEIGDIVEEILEPFERAGVSAAQFFANVVDTETFGIDFVSTYVAQLSSGLLTLTGAFSWTDTDVTAVNVPPEVAEVFTGGDLDAVADVLFNREEQNRLEDALPRVKGLVQAGYRELVLTGVHLGSYGREFPLDCSLAFHHSPPGSAIGPRAALRNRPPIS